MTDKDIKSRYMIQVEAISAKGLNRTVDPDEAECRNIAERLEVPSVQALTSAVNLSRKGRNIYITGKLQSRLRRVCVSSLEEMSEEIEEDIEIHLLRCEETERQEKSGHEDLVTEEELPEPFYEEALDLLEIVTQQLSLAMNPYPRKEGAKPVEDLAEQPSLSPFAELGRLKE